MALSSDFNELIMLTELPDEFKDYLRQRIIDTQEAAGRCRDEVDLRWLQGRQQELEDILELIVTAPDKIEQMRRAAVKPHPDFVPPKGRMQGAF